MPFSCAGLMAGCTPDLTHGAAKLAGPWNVTQARFCGLAPLPGEGAEHPLASPARSHGLGAGQIWLPLSSNGSLLRLGLRRGQAIAMGGADGMDGKGGPPVHRDTMVASQMQLHSGLGPCPEHLEGHCGPSDVGLTPDCPLNWREMATNEIRLKTSPCSETVRTSWVDTVEVMKSVNIGRREC